MAQVSAIYVPIEPDLDSVIANDPDFTDGIYVYDVTEDVVLNTGDNNFFWGVIPLAEQGLDGIIGGVNPFEALPGIAAALAADQSNTIYNYLNIYLFDEVSVTEFADNLDYLNTVIGAGAGHIQAVVVQTGNGTGTDLTQPIIVTADEAADDTNVLAVTTTSLQSASSDEGVVSAVGGADLALEVDDSATNIADELPTILQSLKSYTDFVRLRLDVEDTGQNIAAKLLSIEHTLDTIGSTVNAFFQTNDTGNYDFVTVSLDPSDLSDDVPMTVAQYLPIRQDQAFSNIFYSTNGHATNTIEIEDTAENIEGLSTLLFEASSDVGGNLGFYGSFITKIVATDGPLELSAALATALGDEKISVSAPGGVSVVDSALGIGTPGGGGLSPEDLDDVASIGVKTLTSTDATVHLDVAQVDTDIDDHLSVQAPDGDGVILEDTAANIGDLLKDDSIADIAAVGITQIDPTNGLIQLDVQQVSDLIADNIDIAPGMAVLADRSDNLPDLSTDAISQLIQFGVVGVIATDDVKLTFDADTAKFLLDQPGGIFTIYSGIDVIDTAAHIEALDDDVLTSLTEDEGARFASDDTPLEFSVAQASAIAAGYTEPDQEPTEILAGPDGYGAVLDDSANHLGGIADEDISLFAAMGFDRLNASDGKPIVFDTEQASALAETSFVSNQPVVVLDAAAAVDALAPKEIETLATDDHVVLASDDGNPLKLTVDQVDALENGGSTGTAAGAGPSDALLDDSAAAIADLTAEGFLDLAKINISGIESDDGPLTIDANPSDNQAAALATLVDDGFTISPDLIILDSSTDLEALSAKQIAALVSATGVTLASTDGGLQLTVAQTIALAQGGNTGTASGPPGPNGAIVYDTAANIGDDDLPASLIANLDDFLFIKSIEAEDTRLDLTAAQANAAVDGHVGLIDFFGVSIIDTHAKIDALSAAQLKAIGKAGISALQTTDAALTLNVAQANGAIGAGITKVSSPVGDIPTIADTAKNIGALTGLQLQSLAGAGFGQLNATDAELDLTVAQSLDAVGDHLKLSDGAGAPVAVKDVAARMLALTPAEIAALAGIGVTKFIATDKSLYFTAAQALAIEQAGLDVSVPAGDTANILDTAAHLATLTPLDIDTLAGLGVTKVITGYSVAEYLEDPTGFGGDIAIFDSAANVAAQFDTLNGDANVGSITFTDTGTPVLPLTSTQAQDDARALDEILNPNYEIVIQGQPPQLIVTEDQTLVAPPSGTLSDNIVLNGHTLTIAPAAGAAIDLSGAISNGQGQGGLVIDGPGTVKLEGQNSFSGNIVIQQGALELASPGAAGTGHIVFANDPDLVIDGTTLPTNVIFGFAAGDVIDLRGISFTGGQPMLGPNNVLSFTEGDTFYTLNFDPSVTGDTFAAAADPSGNGTDLELACYVRGARISDSARRGRS